MSLGTHTLTGELLQRIASTFRNQKNYVQALTDGYVAAISALSAVDRAKAEAINRQLEEALDG